MKRSAEAQKPGLDSIEELGELACAGGVWWWEIWDDNYGGDGDGCDSVRSRSLRWPAKDWVTMATKNMARRLKIDGAATCDSFFESDRPCHDTNNDDAKLGEGPAESFHVKDYNSTSINQAVW
ncbi:hypothetical protein M0R45_002521 [Rubus argutus]|uniref:Uncharacterized protein n=1 Tax=Rubus argutus TaxID=59490 RepID=A0AAW1VNW5_RUBAR